MNKKAKINGYGIAIILMLVVVTGLVSWMALKPAPTGTTTTTGGLASFKISSIDSSSTNTRYAGTGYCWKANDPEKTLLGGGSITLSASAGTSVSSVNLGNTITCIAFDSTHYGIEKTVTIVEEGQELQLKTINSSASAFSLTTYYAGDVEDNASTSAGGSVVIDKVLLSASSDYVGFNAKTMCLVSNNSNSELDSASVSGMIPRTGKFPQSVKNNASACFDFATEQMYGRLSSSDARPTNKEIIGNIQLDFSNQLTATEVFSIQLFDNADYVNTGTTISKGLETDATTPVDTGVGYVVGTFTVDVTA